MNVMPSNESCDMTLLSPTTKVSEKQDCSIHVTWIVRCDALNHMWHDSFDVIRVWHRNDIEWVMPRVIQSGCQPYRSSCHRLSHLVGSIKLQVSFATETYRRDCILQKRPGSSSCHGLSHASSTCLQLPAKNPTGGRWQWFPVRRWLMIAFITYNSNLGPLLEGLRSSNPCRSGFLVFRVFAGIHYL